MKRISVILALIILTTATYGQSVGLVFSGGGAKCLAQIGVLKALEEHDIPIDYITGTSGGAIVGGLYASGYSVEDMIELFASGIMESYLITSQEPNLGYYSMEERQNANWYSFRFDFKPKFKYDIIRPSLIISNAIDFGIIQFFSQATTACGGDFDSLMVKFRSVATSVNDNKPYYFRDGDLGLSIRASLAFPFVFEPVSYKGMVLLDGGMYDNFPYKIMVEDFNPDVIIGCLVSDNFPPAKADDIISVVQNVFMQNMELTMPENSVLIEPAVLDIGLLEFEKVHQLVDSGYNSCMEKMPQILEMISRRETESERREKRDQFNHKKPPLFFYKIEAEGVNEKQEEYISVMIDKNKDILSAKEVDKNYSLIQADNVIQSINPQAIYDTTHNQYILNLRIKEKRHFEASLGGNFSIGGQSQGYLGVKFRDFNRHSWSTTLDGYFGSFYNSINLSNRINYPSNALLYAIADIGVNHKDYQGTTPTINMNRKTTYLIQREIHGCLKLGLSLSKRSDLSLSVAYFNTNDRFYNTERYSSEDTNDEDIFKGANINLCFSHNTLNDKTYPTKGTKFRAKIENTFGTEEYIAGSTSLHESFSDKKHNWYTANILYNGYSNITEKFSIGLIGELQLSTQNVWSNYETSIIHADTYEPFDDIKLRFLDSNRGYNFVGAGVKLIYSLPMSLMLQAEAHCFAPFNKIEKQIDQNAALGKLFAEVNYMANLGIIFKNNVAPISINFSLYDSKSIPYALTFNIGYILFNKYARE